MTKKCLIIVSNHNLTDYIENDSVRLLIMSTNLDEKYQDLISNKQAIFNGLRNEAKKQKEEFETTYLEKFLTDELTEELEEKLDFSDAEMIEFSISKSELDKSIDPAEELYSRVKKYMANNEVLKNKKISLNHVNMDDFEKLNKLIKYFGEVDNVYVEMENQINHISVPDLKR